MEKWDAYTRDGEKTGGVLIRGEDMPQGLYHLVCSALVRHRDGSYLLMRRSMQKPNYPGWYEATAGGSALMGEDRLQCVRRELMEETGIECDAFEEIGRFVRDDKQCIFYVYTCTVDCDKDSVKLQTGETEGYVWMTEAEFIGFVNSGRMIPTQKARYAAYFERLGYLR